MVFLKEVIRIFREKYEIISFLYIVWDCKILKVFLIVDVWYFDFLVIREYNKFLIYVKD